MYAEERKEKLNNIIKSTEQQIKKISSEIDNLSKTKKTEKENKEIIIELYKDIKELETRIDTYYFLGHELEIF